MAPTKFVAPLKKNGGESFSFSSAMSSSGSVTISPAETTLKPPMTTVQAAPPPAANDAKKLVVLSQTAQQESSKPTMKRPVAFQILKEVTPNNSQVPPLKKQKRDPISQTTASENTVTDGDKENQNLSKPQKKVTEDKRPCKSLTDKQYDLIFKAVLSKYSCDKDSEPSNLNAGNTEPANESFHLSQSDLEDECEVKGDKSTKECSSNVNVKMQVNNEIHAPENVDSKILSEKSLSETSNVEKDIDNNGSQFQIIHEASGEDGLHALGVPPSPCITFLCHQSQPDPDVTSTQIKTPSKCEGLFDNSETMSHCSQGSTSAKSNICPENFMTPQKQAKNCSTLNSSITPMGKMSVSTISSSQDLPSTPIVMLSRPSSQSLHTPVSTSSKNSSTMQSSQSLQGLKSPFATPHQSSSGSQLLESSQEPLTPVRIPKQLSSVPGTPQSALLKVASPAPNTPQGSQQLSQELQQTPPPQGLSAKERLLWLQEKRRETGVWVQCDETQCGKWRLLPDCHDPSTLPKIWRCAMHPDETLNHCDAEEKRLNLREEEDMIFNKYSPGSLVWAKLSGYPWWPAMVEDDPDLEMFYWLNLFSDIPTWYHVVFFDDVDRPRTRAWVQVERLQNFESRLIDEDLSPELVGFKKRVSAAAKVAHSSRAMSLKERLDRYSFAVSYKGPIGGPSKRKYQGQIGHRKLISD